jgi:hypothetical protein
MFVPKKPIVGDMIKLSSDYNTDRGTFQKGTILTILTTESDGAVTLLDDHSGEKIYNIFLNTANNQYYFEVMPRPRATGWND